MKKKIENVSQCKNCVLKQGYLGVKYAAYYHMLAPGIFEWKKGETELENGSKDWIIHTQWISIKTLWRILLVWFCEKLFKFW